MDRVARHRGTLLDEHHGFLVVVRPVKPLGLGFAGLLRSWIIHEQNEGCLSARSQGWPVVSASLRARYRCSASVAASSSAWR
jgi:hypothetical protein